MKGITEKVFIIGDLTVKLALQNDNENNSAKLLQVNVEYQGRVVEDVKFEGQLRAAVAKLLKRHCGSDLGL